MKKSKGKVWKAEQGVRSIKRIAVEDLNMRKSNQENIVEEASLLQRWARHDHIF